MRKKWIILSTVLICMLLFGGCGKEEIDPSRLYQLYVVSNTETRVETREYVMQSDSSDGQLEELLGCLATMPDKLEYKAPLAMGFQVLDYELEDGKLMLNMDAHYKDMKPTTEVLVRAAIVSTLTQLSEVSLVGFTVGGNPLYDAQNNLIGMMKADQFINNEGSEINTVEVAHLKLYYANEEGNSLISVNRDKPYNSNIALEKLVVELIISGPDPKSEGLYPVVNPGTQILSVTTKDGVCYVNLDDNFLNQIYNVSADVTIYAIVNSLVELSNVNKVQISINGDTTGIYREKYSFSTVFERNLDIVTTLDKK